MPGSVIAFATDGNCGLGACLAAAVIVDAVGVGHLGADPRAAGDVHEVGVVAEVSAERSLLGGLENYDRRCAIAFRCKDIAG